MQYLSYERQNYFYILIFILEKQLFFCTTFLKYLNWINKIFTCSKSRKDIDCQKYSRNNYKVMITVVFWILITTTLMVCLVFSFFSLVFSFFWFRERGLCRSYRPRPPVPVCTAGYTISSNPERCSRPSKRAELVPS